jgi:tetratricopeptide (TPR) repeat protein
MDFTLSLSSDWYNLLSLPLILLTLKDVIPKWKSIWDRDFSMEDRRLLMRTVIFLVLPVVVFIHELGHLLAALAVGARIYDFHYGPVAGHVTVDSHLAPEKLLWIAVAGNLAQIVLGIISLALAIIIRSAPAVAFFVYLGLFSIGDTVIFYAALSLASYYGDWMHIYQSPCTDLVYAVGIVHAILVILIIFCMTNSAARLWFTRRTMPGWSGTHERLLKEAAAAPSAEKYIALINSCLAAGLFKEADRYLAQASAVDAGNIGVEYARAELLLARGNLDKAQEIFEKLAADETLSSRMRASIVFQIGDLWLCKHDTARALNCFEAAVNLDELQGDARLQRSILKTNLEQYNDLQEDLSVLKSGNTQWLYRRNQEAVQGQIEKLESLIAGARQGKGT